MALGILGDSSCWEILGYVTQIRGIAQAGRLVRLLDQESYLRTQGFYQADKLQQLETLSLQQERILLP